MSGRGGKRPGAGRPKGSRKKTTALDQQNMILNAQKYSHIALDTLAEIAEHGESEAARIAASVHLLDRAFGKPIRMQIAVPADPFTERLHHLINTNQMESHEDYMRKRDAKKEELGLGFWDDLPEGAL